MIFLASCAGPGGARFPTQLQTTCIGLDGIPVLPVSAATPDFATFRAQCCSSRTPASSGCPQTPSQAIDYLRLGAQVARSQSNIQNALARILLAGQEKAATIQPNNSALLASLQATRARLANYKPIPPPSVTRNPFATSTQGPNQNPLSGAYSTTIQAQTADPKQPPSGSETGVTTADVARNSYFEGVRAAGRRFQEQLTQFMGQSAQNAASEGTPPPPVGGGVSSSQRDPESEPTPAAADSPSTHSSSATIQPTRSWVQLRPAPGRPGDWLVIPRTRSLFSLAYPHTRWFNGFVAKPEAAPTTTPEPAPSNPPESTPAVAPASDRASEPSDGPAPELAPEPSPAGDAPHPAPGNLFVPAGQ